MKLNYLFGAVAACGLIAGAAYAQSSSTTSPSGAVNDTTAGASGSMSTPSTPDNSGAAATSGSSSMTSGAADNSSAPSTGVSATSATTYGQGASVTVGTTTNGPVPDTPENRKKYGGPMSHAGRHTAAKGN